MHNTLNRLIIGATGGLIAAHLLTPALPTWAQNDTLGTLVGTFQLVQILQALRVDHITASQTLLGISSAVLALWPTLCLPGTPVRRVAAQAEMVLGAVLGALAGWTWGVMAGPQWTHLNSIALEQRPLVAAFAGMVVGALCVRSLLHILVTTMMRYGTTGAVLPQTLLLTALTGVASGAHLPMVTVLPGALAWGQALYLLIPPPGGWRVGLPGRRAPIVLAPSGAVWWTRSLVLVALTVSGWLLMQPI